MLLRTIVICYFLLVSFNIEVGLSPSKKNVLFARVWFIFLKHCCEKFTLGEYGLKHVAQVTIVSQSQLTFICPNSAITLEYSVKYVQS